VDADLDTLATALYARSDDLLKDFPERVPPRPTIGIGPRISDAEIVTMAVLQHCWGCPAKPVGCATPVRICGTCSPTCRSNPGRTSGSADWPRR